MQLAFVLCINQLSLNRPCVVFPRRRLVPLIMVWGGQAIAISGQKMSKNEKMSKPLKQWLATLAGWSDDVALEARIRFKIKDLQVCSSYNRRDAIGQQCCREHWV